MAARWLVAFLLLTVFVSGGVALLRCGRHLLSRRGQFRITPLPNGDTLLEGTTWYQHGLWPAQYWRCWSDAIIHRIHLRVLNHVRMLAEKEAQRAW